MFHRDYTLGQRDCQGCVLGQDVSDNAPMPMMPLGDVISALYLRVDITLAPSYDAFDGFLSTGQPTFLSEFPVEHHTFLR